MVNLATRQRLRCVMEVWRSLHLISLSRDDLEKRQANFILVMWWFPRYKESDIGCQNVYVRSLSWSKLVWQFAGYLYNKWQENLSGFQCLSWHDLFSCQLSMKREVVALGPNLYDICQLLLSAHGRRKNELLIFMNFHKGKAPEF